jgi:hypothetical protein
MTPLVDVPFGYGIYTLGVVIEVFDDDIHKR